MSPALLVPGALCPDFISICEITISVCLVALHRILHIRHARQQQTHCPQRLSGRTELALWQIDASIDGQRQGSQLYRVSKYNYQIEGRKQNKSRERKH